MTDLRNMAKSYAIIGFGKIGQALAKAFARNHIKVTVATTRDPQSFAAEAAQIGPEIVPVTLLEALNADIIFLAVRFESHQNVAKALPNWQGKTIVDMTNAYGIDPEKMEGLPSAMFVAKAFTGAKLVKGFNHLAAAILGQDPVVNGGKRVAFLTSNDEKAIEEIALLSENLGFAPVSLGSLAEGGLLVQAHGNSWGKLIFQDMVKFGR